jgi:hypothetical protein
VRPFGCVAYNCINDLYYALLFLYNALILVYLFEKAESSFEELGRAFTFADMAV